MKRYLERNIGDPSKRIVLYRKQRSRTTDCSYGCLRIPVYHCEAEICSKKGMDIPCNTNKKISMCL